MAPEVFAGKVSVKSDQYALGCIAYELITGHKPLEVEGVPLYVHTFLTALQTPQIALQIPQTSAQEWLKKGNALRDLKRYEQALAAYEQVLRLDPNFAKAYHNKGLVLDKLGRTREAQQAYNKAKQLS